MFVAPYSVHLVLDDDASGWEVDWDIYDPSGNRISGGFTFGAGGGGRANKRRAVLLRPNPLGTYTMDGTVLTRDAQFNETKMALTPASFRVVDTAMPPPTPPSTVEQTWTTTLILQRGSWTGGDSAATFTGRVKFTYACPSSRCFPPYARRVSIEAKHNGSWSRIYAKAYVGVASRVRLKVPYKYDKIRAKAGRLVANTDDSPVIIYTADKSNTIPRAEQALIGQKLLPCLRT